MIEFKDNTRRSEFWETYSKPMCEWMTSRAHRMESVTGFNDPAAKGAMVNGIMPAATTLHTYISTSFNPWISFFPYQGFTHLSKLQW
jgi:hypothetical protein